MSLDVTVALGGLVVGFVVGLTGMGGGALMTPMLVLVFGVNPLTAVSSDLVAAVAMKPVGGAVHFRRGTVNTGLVKWLCLGSVPAAFLGVLLLRLLENHVSTADPIRYVLGVALLVASTALVAKGALAGARPDRDHAPIAVRPIPTVAIGVLGGLVVGMTSVGSGSLMIVLLMVLYPTLTTKELVGTDLVQAVPLVASAALGHLLFGDFELGLTASVLVGSIPGVYLGARVSSKAPDHVIRPVLVLVLVASGLKLLGVPTEVVAWILLAVVGAGLATMALLRSRARAAVPAAEPGELAVATEVR